MYFQIQAYSNTILSLCDQYFCDGYYFYNKKQSHFQDQSIKMKVFQMI